LEVNKGVFMTAKVGRNDPCPCGSGKKFKQCCFLKQRPGQPRKFSAKVIQSGTGIPQPPDLMDRVFGESIQEAQKEEKPPLPQKDA
jgi:hypothetical protein